MSDLLKKKRWIFYLEGSILLILGVFALVLPQITTVSLGIMAGLLLIITGITMTYRAIRFKQHEIFWSSLFAGIVALVLGVLMLRYITAGIYALTFFFIAYLCFEGILKIILASVLKPLKNWGYMLFSGISALLLAFLVIVGMPLTAFWALGFIFGVYLIIAGFSTIAFGIGLEKMIQPITR